MCFVLSVDFFKKIYRLLTPTSEGNRVKHIATRNTKTHRFVNSECSIVVLGCKLKLDFTVSIPNPCLFMIYYKENMRRSRKFCQRGSNKVCFLFFMRGEDPK